MNRVLALLLWGLAIAPNAVAKDKEQPLYTFTFEGSIQEACDYFVWTAVVYKDRISSQASPSKRKPYSQRVSPSRNCPFC